MRKVKRHEELYEESKEYIIPMIDRTRKCFDNLKKIYEDNKDPFNLQKVQEVFRLLDVLQFLINHGELNLSSVDDYFTKFNVILYEMLSKNYV